MLQAMYSNPAQRLAIRMLVDKRLFRDIKKEAADILVGEFVGAMDGAEVEKTCETVTLR